MSKLKRWLPLLALIILVNIRLSLSSPIQDHQKDNNTKLIGSSKVASVSGVTYDKNGTSSPDSRKVVPAYEPLASPADLLRPDRFQFYTFNNNGDVVTKQMTEKEIQSLIAAGGGHYPMEIHEPLKTDNILGGETKVADVVQNVQNVLKGELSKPTTMMVPVPTVPGHATDEWSNILPSILSGDSEPSHPVNGISQLDNDKSTMSAKPIGHQPTNIYDMYKPQPAIIVEMEPHVHEPPSQILDSDFLDHHERPLDMKPHVVKPSTEKEDSSLDQVPLQIWSTSTKGPDFHFITTEIVPSMKNHSSNKVKISTPKPITANIDHRHKNTTAETLNMYSEIPMIPVSVITADQILTSTQKNKINERPIFQILSTISPSTAVSTTKPNDTSDQKSEDVSIISETHTTSVKYSGHPEMKVTDEGSQTTVSVRIKPTSYKKNTTNRFTSTPMVEATTESIFLTMYSTLTENESTALNNLSTNVKDDVTPMILTTTTKDNVTPTALPTKIKNNFTSAMSSNDSINPTTTEMNPQMLTDTTIMTEITSPKFTTEPSMNVTNTKHTTTNKPASVGMTEQKFETTTTDVMKEESTIFERITSTLPTTINDMLENDEILPTDLANSLSSVISQVAETIPTILTETQNFPLSELKSKNISMSNDMFDSTTSNEITEEISTVTEEVTVESTSMLSSEQTTIEPNIITTTVTESNEDMLLTDKPDIVYEKITDNISQVDSTTDFVTERSDSNTISTVIYNNSSPPPFNNTEMLSTNKSNEKDTEATIIHLDVTGAPSDASVPQYTTENGNNISESPLIRIQLADIVSAVNHMIENAPLKLDMPSVEHNMTLPPNPYTETPHVASGLIAGFLSNTMKQELEANINNNYNTEEVTTVKYSNDENKLSSTTSSVSKADMKTETDLISVNHSADLPHAIQKTTSMQATITETPLSLDKIETTTNIINDNVETTTSSLLKTSDQTNEPTTMKFITTTEYSTSKYSPNKTKKPEPPIVRIDISPENTSSNLPPRIQLTDLPIIQESTTLSNNVNMESETTTNISNEKPSLHNININNSNDNVNIENFTKVTPLPHKNNESIATQVPCTFDMKNISKCQNQLEENTTLNTQLIEQNNTQNANRKDNLIEMKTSTTEVSMNVIKNETAVNNSADSVKTHTSTPTTQALPDKYANYMQNPFNNETKISHQELINSSTNKYTSATESTITTYENKVKNESSSTTTRTQTKEDVKSTTPLSIKNTPSKIDSYIKLGEQLSKDQVNKTSTSLAKPQKTGIKRQPTTTTFKPITSKISSSSSTLSHKFSPKPTKAPSTTIQALPIQEKKPEIVSDANKNTEEQRWTLIPQQLSTSFTNKVKQDVTESPVSSSTMFPNGDINDYSHRTGSKPVNLEVVKNSAGLDDSVRNLDQDIQFFSNLCNELAFNFWTSANKGLSNSRSLALSPFGMTSMLAMIFLGARGPTSAQMNDILKLDDVATFNPHLVFQNITDAVSLARNQGIANAAFVRLLFAYRIKVGKLMPFYKEQAQKFYEGFVAEVNFSTISDQVKRRTNLLVRKQTGGRIKDFVKTNSVPLRSPLAALSANVFQTNCNSTGASSEGRDGEMYFAVSPAIRQRRLVPVPATVWRSGVLAGYEPGLDATAIALGGSEKLVSTIFVIPGQQGFTAPGDTLDRLEQRLMRSAYRDNAWDKLLKVIVPRPALELQVPKFSHRSVVNATAALKRMGLEELFSRHANLKGINGFGHDIHLADVLQMNLFSTCGDENISSGRHHVEIYPGSPMRNNRQIFLERKVESLDSINASPDSMSSYDIFAEEYAKNPRLIKNWSREAEISEKPRLRLDRPFLYFVRHNPTGLILHMGRFNPRLLQ